MVSEATVENGVKIEPLEEWIIANINGDWDMLWAPLSEESRKNFNYEKLMKWWNDEGILGSDYNFADMLPMVWDSPMGNQPAWISQGVVWAIMAAANKLGEKSVVDKLFTGPINARLGTPN